MFLNTRVPPFDRLDARRAVSLAIDRDAAWRPRGGAHAARPTCHILPPTFSGYRPDCPRSDLPRRAGSSALGHPRRARGPVTPASPSYVTPLLVRALRSLGYRTSVRKVPLDDVLRPVGDPSDPGAGRPDRVGGRLSVGVVVPRHLFSCRSFVPRSTNNVNSSQFCDPRADALIRRATEAQASDPRAADALWARAERRVLDAAPAVPLFNPVDTDLVSARVRNDQYNPQWGFLPDQAWVR